MPQFFGYGTELVREDRYLTLSDGELRKLAARQPRSAPRTKAFSTELSPARAAAVSPIGIGKPLSVELVHVYTGALSRNGWNRPDLLLASSVKRLPVYDAAPRAMQAVLQSLPERFGFSSLPANVPGTPLVYHTPALTDRGVTVTLEMVFDRFPSEAFDQIGNMLSTAAGIPVFAPASAYLLAGSIIVKLFSRVAEAIIDGKPSFAENLNINVDRPLYEDSAPGFVLLTPSGSLAAALSKGQYTVQVDRGLVDPGGAPYAGPDPYVIAGLDGSERPDYANFTPTMATASILNRFLHTGDGQPTATGLIIDALKAYNDVYYRSMADGIKKRLASLPQDGEEAGKLRQLLDAYIKNIGNDDLKPRP